MKTINDFKEEVAKEEGYESAKTLSRWAADQAAERYAEYMCICFCEDLKDYTRESETILGHDERTVKELYDIFKSNKA